MVVVLAGLIATASAGAAPPSNEDFAKPEIIRIPAGPRITIAMLPGGTRPTELEQVDGLTPGLFSARLGRADAEQTFLDITQGNRVFTSLYEGQLRLRPFFRDTVPGWPSAVDRAEGAPADLVPGLLGSTVESAGVRIAADSNLALPAVIAADREGKVERTKAFQCLESDCPGVSIVAAGLPELPSLVERLRGEDLLIALERPPPGLRHELAIGVAGRGFDSGLRSDTTRTDGLVASVDIAPTILDRLGIEIPDEMNGRPIGAGSEELSGERLEDVDRRLSVIAPRRTPVILANVAIWTAIALAIALALRGRAARVALSLLALAIVYVPLLLLVGAAVDPSRLAERLLVGVGSPLLAALTMRLARGYAGLAIASGVTLGAYLLDVIAGSGLTKLSLLGPNPALGVRFYGIGNELEAIFAVLVPIGVGAALTASRDVDPDRAARAFLLAGAGVAIILAAGRFGADVGAAIVVPVGAAVAAAVAARIRGRGRTFALLAATPLIGLAALAAIDLVSGGGAHLSRSVLDAGGASDIADVLDRRLTLSADSFTREDRRPYLALTLIVIAIVVYKRQTIVAWFEGRRAALAGFAGAAAATLIGTVANDSGSLLLMVGTGLMLVCGGFGWAQRELDSGLQEGVRE